MAKQLSTAIQVMSHRAWARQPEPSNRQAVDISPHCRQKKRLSTVTSETTRDMISCASSQQQGRGREGNHITRSRHRTCWWHGSINRCTQHAWKDKRSHTSRGPAPTSAFGRNGDGRLGDTPGGDERCSLEANCAGHPSHEQIMDLPKGVTHSWPCRPLASAFADLKASRRKVRLPWWQTLQVHQSHRLRASGCQPGLHSPHNKAEQNKNENKSSST
ncbi:hypothetical protein BD289DRAFT_430314 [Coniella lustricola]|uniref:Uncharacterized protein n=1 Tax=Coniella lustricola TaxID=2025994 RepID=A0A2T3AC63_9PEZI|nr:hypothetical protein BD289DRAFT_430314 [Coniella lustricola]